MQHKHVLVGFSTEHMVDIVDGVPTCSPEHGCSYKRSTKPPCPDEVAVCNWLKVPFMNERHLHPRWRLRGHPLFLEAVLHAKHDPSEFGIKVVAAYSQM